MEAGKYSSPGFKLRVGRCWWGREVKEVYRMNDCLETEAAMMHQARRIFLLSWLVSTVCGRVEMGGAKDGC